jgi:pimeloyl-ACP methyl ester carboxylesterase
VIVGQSYGAFTATLAASQLPARLLVLLAGMIPVPEKAPASGKEAERRAERVMPAWKPASGAGRCLGPVARQRRRTLDLELAHQACSGATGTRSPGMQRRDRPPPRLAAGRSSVAGDGPSCERERRSRSPVSQRLSSACPVDDLIAQMI